MIESRVAKVPELRAHTDQDWRDAHGIWRNIRAAGPFIGVSFGTNWADYGTYQTCQYRKVGDIVSLRGLANSAANLWASYPTICTLPVGYRPPAELIFCQWGAAGVTLRVDVCADGTVIWITGGAGAGYISLDGISFSIGA